jgi:hypothetical protein
MIQYPDQLIFTTETREKRYLHAMGKYQYTSFTICAIHKIGPSPITLKVKLSL